jgi:hypothetical protein
MRLLLPQGFWHHKNFLTFWTGETLSASGSQVTAFILPVPAVLALHTTVIQMGILSFFVFAPPNSHYLPGNVPGLFSFASKKGLSLL